MIGGKVLDGCILSSESDRRKLHFTLSNKTITIFAFTLILVAINSQPELMLKAISLIADWMRR